MRRTLIMVLALVASASLSLAAYAGQGVTDYSPGVVKSLVEKGETVLIDYSAVW